LRITGAPYWQDLCGEHHNVVSSLWQQGILRFYVTDCSPAGEQSVTIGMVATAFAFYLRA
jgi:hypothetical protein